MVAIIGALGGIAAAAVPVIGDRLGRRSASAPLPAETSSPSSPSPTTLPPLPTPGLAETGEPTPRLQESAPTPRKGPPARSGGDAPLIAAERLQLVSPPEFSVDLKGQVMSVRGRVLRALPRGYEVWVVTREYNPLDGTSLTGPFVSVDPDGACSVVGADFDCNAVNIGGDEEHGEYLAFVVLAAPDIARLFEQYRFEQRTQRDYEHTVPPGVSSLGPITISRRG